MWYLQIDILFISAHVKCFSKRGTQWQLFFLFHMTGPLISLKKSELYTVRLHQTALTKWKNHILARYIQKIMNISIGRTI